MVPESIFATLGVAAPLVAILYYLLRQATDERKEITRMFLQAQTTSQAENTKALQSVQDAMRELTAQTTTEHIQITTALQAVTGFVSSEMRQREEAVTRGARERERGP